MGAAGVMYMLKRKRFRQRNIWRHRTHFDCFDREKEARKKEKEEEKGRIPYVCCIHRFFHRSFQVPGIIVVRLLQHFRRVFLRLFVCLFH